MSKFALSKKSVLLSTMLGFVFSALGQYTPQTTPGSSSTSTTGTGTEKPTTFIKDAARDNDMVLGLAEAGAAKAQNADLKSFCSDLQKDHMQANTQLQSLAQKYNVTLEQSATKRTERERTRYEKYTGSEFDQKLATGLLEEHQKLITEFDKAAQQADASDVKQFANDMQSKLRQHFQKGEQIAQSVGVDQSTITAIEKKLPAGMGGTGTSLEPQPSVGTEDQSGKGAGAKRLQPQSNP